ncbi:polysaccharide pyruvyl transferase family protein [Falsirhodobacter sp. alg1]|uniref:polysaccharide pyruvyl transferase family protein n=1 Tax=Falsirhodobacter sp. alg1 TaxID=1472418 RepID=UPI000788ABFC|nr:polysaccharide pyruvyl transferase family protein [Falsirhodobacter sp. alg1]
MSISTVVTSMKDEAPYVIEWVAYHRALGFDKVVLLANDCTDGTHEMLLRLHEMGAISYYENEVPVGAKPHSRALKIANTTPEVKSADFVMVLDADEFLVVKRAPHTLDVLLDVMQDKSSDMMVIPWRMFGSSHNAEFQDRPVIERFTQSMDASARPKVGVKTLFRNSDNLRLAIHFPKPLMKGGKPVESPANSSWIDAGGQPLDPVGLTWNGGRQTIHRDLAEVAHFMIKSLDEYLLKIFRGDGLMNSSRHGIDYWRNADYNDVSDLVVADNVSGFVEERDRLFADPVLAELHRRSVANRFAKLENILANPDVQTLRGILKKSTSGELTEEDALRSRELVKQMSPVVKTDKLIDGDVPHSTLLTITDAGTAIGSGVAWRMSKKAPQDKVMFLPEKKFGARPITNLIEAMKRTQADEDKEASLLIRWFYNYTVTNAKDDWPLDEEHLVVVTRDDENLLADYPGYIAKTKAKYVLQSQNGKPALREVFNGTETAAEVEALIAAGKVEDPRLKLREFVEANPRAILLNIDRPDDLMSKLEDIEDSGPSGPLVAKLLRETLDLDLSQVVPPPALQKEMAVAPAAVAPLPSEAPALDISEPVSPASSASKQIGIMTLPMNRNYGGNLQAFALMKTLRGLGHRPVLLNRRNSKAEPSKTPEDLALDAAIPLYSSNIGLGKNVPNRVFVEEHMTPISRQFYSSFAMNRHIDRYELDAVIVGSDQVWRPKYSRDILSDFFLNFLEGTKRPVKRISYAASFGSEHDEYSRSEKAMATPLLQSFDAVAVREDCAVDMCREMFGVEAQHVLDPTMLLTRDDYAELLSEEQRTAAGNHLLTYVLDATPDKLDVINRISETLSIDPVTTSGLPFESADPLKSKGGDKSVEGWLAAFRNAAYVVTDSFHGVAFSIIFNRPFVAYGNAERGLARFKSLLKAVGLEDRIVVKSDEVDVDRLLLPIDWPAVNQRLAALREKSVRFLVDALSDQPGGDGGGGGRKSSPASIPAPEVRNTGALPTPATAATHAAPAAATMTEEKHPLNVQCTGCGVCVSEADGALKMGWTKNGFLEPRATGKAIPDNAIRVCPFNPAPEKAVQDEDALAEIFLPEADRTDARLGRFLGTYVGYSKAFRPTSSSGGIATYVFDKLLEKGVVDWLFVVRKTPDGYYAYRAFQKTEDVKTMSKTRYFPVTMEHLFSMIENIEGRVAVSGVACFLKAIRLKQHYHPELKEKIPFLAGIICGGLKSHFYTDFLAQSTGIRDGYTDAEYRVKNPKSLSSDYIFAAKDLRGEEHRVRMQKLGDMWGTGLFKSKACDFCTDVMTELADISLGDAWLPEYKQDGMGNSVIITRTRLADNIILNGIQTGELEAKVVSNDIAARTQSGGFNHKQKAVKFRMVMQDMADDKAIPFVRPRIQAESSIAEMLVQILRERSRGRSLTIWKEQDDNRRFMRRMRPTLRLLSAVTNSRKQSDKVQSAVMQALEAPAKRTVVDEQIAAIRPMIIWVKNRLASGEVDINFLARILPGGPTQIRQ